jgi:YHYH protein
MFIASFHYAANGQPEWLTMQGNYTASDAVAGRIGSFSGVVSLNTNGQCIGCAYVRPSTSTSTQSPVTINFTSNQRATLTWPGETISLQRQFWAWRDQVDQLDGNWLLTSVSNGTPTSQVVKITANTSATTRTATIASLTGTSVGSLSVVNNALTLLLGTQSLTVLSPEASRFYAGSSTSTALQVVAVRLTDTPFATATSTTPIGTSSTAGVLCPFTGSFAGNYSTAGALTANWSWACSTSTRTLTGNGLPNHAVGTFPNAGNPNTISAQNVSASMTLTPVKSTTNTQIGGPGGANVYALNSVKFDPGTAGTCPGTMTSIANCNLAMGTDVWRMEALGQSSFNFGVDANNAHVQPDGSYHYHGLPSGLLSTESAVGSKMQLIGWAADGFPMYANYGFSDAKSTASSLRKMRGSYRVKLTADAGRPPVTSVPMGAFQQDYEYVAGFGDLDECNGRISVTPEFPQGTYHYYVTDSYPYVQRCVKGTPNQTGPSGPGARP